MPYGAISFTLNTCTATPTVRITFGDPIEGMTFYKYSNNAWIPLAGVTINGNEARFSIEDNGAYDSNDTTGTIQDPVAPRRRLTAQRRPGRANPLFLGAARQRRTARLPRRPPGAGAVPLKP